MDQPKSTEENFFDQHVADPGKLKIYQQIQGLDFAKPFQDYFNLLLGNLNKQVVLEYGCGNYGDLSLQLAEQGAKAVAIDLSGESVKSTRRVLSMRGYERQVATIKMDCEQLAFNDESFDVVVGRAVLHHLDLNKACTEIRRVLKRNGRAVFIEPMGMNPLINLYRWFTPGQRTPGEQPLINNSFQTIKKHFKNVEHKEFNLFPLFIFILAGFFKDKSKLAPVLKKLQLVDEFVFKCFPFLSRFAWTTVISLS